MKRGCAHVNARGTQCRRSALDGSDTCTVHAPGYVRPARELPPPEAMHGAEVTEPQRAACGDVHNEYEVCRVCDLGARAEAGCGDCLDPMCTGAPCKHASTASAVSPEANRPVAEGPVEAVDAASLALDARGVQLWRADWRQLAEVARKAGGVDALIVDAPYSATVHAGHGTMERHGTSTPPAYDGAERREIDYGHWTRDDVRAFVETWSPLVRGWFVAQADDELAIEWKRALCDAGRLAFPLIPCTERGATVRMAGEGPSSCTTFLVVARPRTADAMRAAFGLSYESHHVGPREKKPVIGGKPVWLMREIVRAYTRPGDLVCDPCAGAGTLGVACIAEGRRALLGDRDAAHVEIARKRLLSCPGEQRRLTLDVEAPAMVQAGFDLDDDSGA